jgi:predicted transposase/invertase (TIGR01784 family)
MNTTNMKPPRRASAVNPHDAFFRTVFSRPEVAIDFFRHYLPADIADQLDLDSLEYQPESFVDHALRELYSDLLFKVDLRDRSDAYLYILMEHKSYQARTTAYQLLRYIVSIWETARKDEDMLNFPIVIPVLVYHGKARWRHGTNLQQLVGYPEAFTRFLPDFEYVLWDASAYNDDDIRGTVILQVALLLFRHIFSEDLRDRLPGILKLLSGLVRQRPGRDFLETVLRYLLLAAPRGHLSRDEIANTVKQTIPQLGGDIMMTIADTLIEEGFEKGVQTGMQTGIEKGMQRGALQNARENLFDVLDIRFATVPRSLISTIEGVQDAAVLKILHRKAVQADSLEAFARLVDDILR